MANSTSSHYPLSLQVDCFDYVRVFSSGLWATPRGTSILQHALFRFNVQLILYVSVANSIHFFLRRIHIPKLTSDILAGFFLGPCFFETYFPRFAGLVFNSVRDIINAPNNVVASIGKVGYILFTFLAGLRIDPSIVSRMGRETMILGIAMSAISPILSLTLDFMYIPDFPTFLAVGRTRFLQMYFHVMTRCNFISVVHVLMQLKITNSRVGHVALASQLVSELIGFLELYIGEFSMKWHFVKHSTAFQSVFLTLLFTGTMVAGVPPLVYYFIRMTPKGQPVKLLYINIIVMIVFASSYLAELAGMFYMVAPFLCGLLIPSGTPVARDLIAKLESFCSGTMIPLMATFCASKFDYRVFLNSPPLVFYISLIAFSMKLVVIFFVILACCKLSVRDTAAVALALHYKGVLELGTLLIYGNLDKKDVSSASGVVFVFIFATLFPLIIRLLYDPSKQYIGFDKKSIRLTPLDADLNILACVHRQEDALAAVKLLGHTSSTKKGRLSVYCLFMEELVASSTPVLINHQLKQKAHSIYGSKSEPVMEIFNLYKSQNEYSQVNMFTTVSHLPQMHEDICYLAFEKGASLVILPFHKKWNRKTRRLIPGSNDLRMLNVDVLNRAPCSVGILVDRHGLQGIASLVFSTKEYHVGVLFASGDDDREALAYAMRMVGSARVKLTVVRLVLREEPQMQDRWEGMLDTESLRSFKEHMSEAGFHVYFREESVEDGAGIAALLEEMKQRFDLIIVGRRHDPNISAISQLSEWTDLSELGPFGDLLAGEDITDSVSVLIMQHQQLKAQNSSLLNRPTL